MRQYKPPAGSWTSAPVVRLQPEGVSRGAAEFCRAAIANSLAGPVSAAAVWNRLRNQEVIEGYERHSSRPSSLFKSLTASRLLSFSASFGCLFGTPLVRSDAKQSLISFRFLAACLSKSRKVITTTDNADASRSVGKFRHIMCKQLQSS